MERQIVKAARRHFVSGDPASVREQVEAWVAMTSADEVMVTTMVYAPQARLRSYELLAEAFGLEADPQITQKNDPQNTQINAEKG